MWIFSSVHSLLGWKESINPKICSSKLADLSLQPRFTVEITVGQQFTTCCCSYREICHGDGHHSGDLTRTSHPCSEDGRPLGACCTSQTDVEAWGGWPAAGAGLNAGLKWSSSCSLLHTTEVSNVTSADLKDDFPFCWTCLMEVKWLRKLVCGS